MYNLKWKICFWFFPLMYKDQWKKPPPIEGSSQFYWYWRTSTLIKYFSILGAKNVKSVSRSLGQSNGNSVRGNYRSI